MNQNTNVEKTFSLALENHQKNNLKKAENLYKQILAENPNHYQSVFFLGTLFAQSKKFDLAKQLLNKAITINKKDSNAHNNLGLVYRDLNQLEKAIDCFEKSIQIEPKHLDAHNNLGLVYKDLNELQKAIDYFEKTIEIEPRYALAYSNLGLVYRDLNELQKAIDYFEKAIGIEPNHVGTHNNLGLVYRDLNQLEKAIDCFEKAIQINSNYVAAHSNLGNLLNSLGNFKKGRIHFEKAIEIQPHNPVAHANFGGLEKALGNFKKAISHFEEATKYGPNSLVYHYQLSLLKNEILDSDLKNKIFEIMNKKNSSNENIAYGNFLLAKYEEKLENYKSEFNYLLKGHEYFLKTKEKKFNKEISLKILPNIHKSMMLDKSDNSFEKANDKIKPIFIFGLPRSGSTLVEKIVASSNEYIPMGEETGVIGTYIAERLKSKQSLDFNSVNYKNVLTEMYNQKKLITKDSNYIFTDKSLDNFFYIKLIKKIFPNAKLINCKRDILSNIISIIKSHLIYIPWAHNLEDIFKYFDNYHQIIKSMNELFPNSIYELQYEKLVNDPLIESKKLLEFCNLPWNTKCLEFYKRKDIFSRTASNIEIRRAIYKDATKKYFPYKRFLDKYKNKYHWLNNENI